MSIAANDVDEIVLALLRECEDVTPPLSGFEIVTLFNERILLESEALVSASLQRLVARGKVEADRSAYRLSEKPETACEESSAAEGLLDSHLRND